MAELLCIVYCKKNVSHYLIRFLDIISINFVVFGVRTNKSYPHHLIIKIYASD